MTIPFVSIAGEGEPLAYKPHVILSSRLLALASRYTAGLPGTRHGVFTCNESLPVSGMKSYAVEDWIVAEFAGVEGSAEDVLDVLNGRLEVMREVLGLRWFGDAAARQISLVSLCCRP